MSGAGGGASEGGGTVSESDAPEDLTGMRAREYDFSHLARAPPPNLPLTPLAWLRPRQSAYQQCTPSKVHRHPHKPESEGGKE